MAINPKAVKQFLARKRRDFSKWQGLSPAEIERRKDNLPITPPIWSRLRLLQKVCLLIGIQERTFAFYNDTGTGKTYLAVALIRYFHKLGELDRAIVLVPRRTNKYEWKREIEKLSPNTPYHVLEGSTASKWKQLQTSKAVLFIDTYKALVWMTCTKVANEDDDTKLVPNPKLVEELSRLLQCVVADEGTVLGDKKNLAFRVIRKLTETVPFFFNLTGTPFGRDPQLLWSQMFLVDRGHTLGETLGLFRSAFYSTRKNYWGQFEHTFRKKQMPLLHQFLKDGSIVYEADAADLPAVVADGIVCELPDDAISYYQAAVERLMQSGGNVQEQKNSFLRMRQISSGFVGYYDDELGTKAKLVFDQQPKRDALLTKIEAIRPDRKIIVFYEFTWSSLQIAKELRKLKIGFAHLYGDTRDVEGERTRFNDDPACRVLLLQNQFGIGLNLQVAQYGLYYEAPLSVMMRKQTTRRIERQGSAFKTVFIYDCLCLDTVDEDILDFYAEGADLYRAIIQGKAKLRVPKGRT